MTAADLIRGAKLRRDEYRVCVDPDLVDEYERLQAELAADRSGESFVGGGRAADIQTRIGEVAENMQASTVTLVLQALPRPVYKGLRDKHPPRKDGDGNLLPSDAVFGVDYDGFYNDLARRSIVEPDLDAETLDILLDEKLSDGQWEQLTSRCHKLNNSTVDVPFLPAGSPSRRHSSAK